MTMPHPQVDAIFWWLYAIVALTLSAWISLVVGRSSLWAVLLVTLLGLIYGIIVLRMRLPAWLGPLALLFAVAVFIALIWLRSSVGPIFFSWLGGFIAGTIFGAWPRLRTIKTRQSPKWYVDNTSFTSVTDVAQETRRRVSELDGRRQYVVTISCHVARMDIAGNANTGLLVYCTSDARNKQNWSLLSVPRSRPVAVCVPVGPNDATVPDNNVVTTAAAYHALESFLRILQPDPELDWLTGDQAFGLRPLSVTHWSGRYQGKRIQ